MSAIKTVEPAITKFKESKPKDSNKLITEVREAVIDYIPAYPLTEKFADAWDKTLRKTTNPKTVEAMNKSKISTISAVKDYLAAYAKPFGYVAVNTEQEESKRPAKAYQQNWTIAKLMIYLEDGDIDFDPTVRMAGEWNAKRKASYLEWVMMEWPTGSFHFNEVSKGQYELIDGKQRAITLWQFIKNEFRLPTKSPTIYCLGGEAKTARKYYKDLPENLQANIGSYFLDAWAFRDMSASEKRMLLSQVNRGRQADVSESTRKKVTVLSGDFDVYLTMGLLDFYRFYYGEERYEKMLEEDTGIPSEKVFRRMCFPKQYWYAKAA